MPTDAVAGSSTSVRVSVWSDYVCPFCYLELPVLDELQRRLGDALTIEWRAFELRPDPVPTLDPNGEYLHRVWKASVYPMAEARGITLQLPPVQPRSRKALEAVEFARAQGKFDAMHRRLFRAFFEHGRDLDDLGTLQDIAVSIGLDGGSLEGALRERLYEAKVLDDQVVAQRLGINGVPAMLVQVLDRSHLLSGAQPVEAIIATVGAIMVDIQPSGRSDR